MSTDHYLLARNRRGETQAGTAKERDDERRLFITPLSRAAPLTSPVRASSYAYDLEVSEELMHNSTRTTRKRSKRRGLSQVGEKRPGKKTAQLFQSEIVISLLDGKNITVRRLGITRAVLHVFMLKLHMTQLIV